MSSINSNKQIIREYVSAFNRGDIASEKEDITDASEKGDITECHSFNDFPPRFPGVSVLLWGVS